MNLVLLLLVTMATYALDAKELEGVILRFQAHPSSSFLVLYHTLNSGNTTKHDGQTYLIMNDGTLSGHLDYQLTKNKTVFITGPLI